nr:transposase (putative), gypsy type [Tanacetum cinerariifolium]
LEALLETEAEIKRAAEGKNAELMRELEDIHAQFSGLKHGVKHGRSQLELESIEAYDPEAEAKFVAALESLKDLKFSLLDQLEGLKDAPMDVIMAALYLESDTGGDAPQYIRDLRPSSSQLTIPVYPEACKEEITLADAIAANISRAEKKKNAGYASATSYGPSHFGPSLPPAAA